MIKSMRLQRFKNFRDATLQLGPLTVIVGTNASGKSNLRDAFRFAHGISRGYSLAEIIGEKYVEGGVLQWKGIRGGIREVAFAGADGFRLVTTLSLPTNEESRLPLPYQLVHEIQVGLGDARLGPRVLGESLYKDESIVFDSHPDDDPPVQEGPPYLFVRLPRDLQNRKHGKRLRFLDSQPVLAQLLDQREVSKICRQSARSYAAALESMRFLDLSPEAMKMPSIPGQVVLGDRGENLSSVLQAICQDANMGRAVAEWIRELTPLDVVDFEFVPDQTGRILVNLIESNGQRTSAYSASDGTLRFLAIIAALLGPDVAKFYFLEEIDNGIHPTRLYLLLQLIEQQAKGKKVQIVTTTHSPQLLGMLSPTAREHASLVYRLEGEREGHIRPVLEIPEAKRVLEEQNLARLHESGWLEDAVAFAESPEATA
ncbi:MAG TPA: ATP-binding protein [Pirellulales bacterium]|nr:ATP-binding protein [Pirellulales bacterium]